MVETVADREKSEMTKGFSIWAGIFLVLFFAMTVASGPRYTALTTEEARALIGGDEYDDYALCDGTNNCVACQPPTCVTGIHECVVDTPGNDGCATDDGTDSYCNSFNLWSDCEYKGGVQSCGGPSNRRQCADMVDYDFCTSWGDGKSGCKAGTNSVEQCQNCATIP